MHKDRFPLIIPGRGSRICGIKADSAIPYKRRGEIQVAGTAGMVATAHLYIIGIGQLE